MSRKALMNLSTQGVIASQALVADNPWSRMKGLLGRKALQQGEALVITQCNSIHMFFMRFAIDVVFVDAKWNVVGLVRGIRPFGLSPVFWKAKTAIELEAGSIDKSGIELGQHLLLEK